MEIFGKLEFSNYQALYLLIYILVPFICIFSFRFKNIQGNNIISKDMAYSLRGAAMLIISIHHLCGFLYQKNIMFPYDDLGYIGSGIFLFFSGYGIAWCMEREEYLNNFIKREFCQYIFVV